MNIKSLKTIVFAAVLSLAALSQLAQIRANRIQISHWIGGAAFGVYACQLYYPGGHAAIAFDSEVAVNRFAAMPQVEVIARKAPVTIVRSDVVVEAAE